MKIRLCNRCNKKLSNNPASEPRCKRCGCVEFRLGTEQDLLVNDLWSYFAAEDFEVEYCFHRRRKWRLDVAFPAPHVMVAVEIDGRGRHNRAKGQREDMEKRNCAVAMSWRVLTYPAASVRTDKRRALIVDQIRSVVHSSPDDFDEVLTTV